MKKLAQEIINGKRLTRNEDLSFFESCNLKELSEGADLIREHFMGNKVDLCTIISGRSGKCPENCKYCAQSAHWKTDCKEFDFLDTETFVNACEINNKEGVDRFSIVTSGKALGGEEFEKALDSFKALHEKFPKMKLCASMGFLTKEQLVQLKQAGVSRYHHNIETSENYFPSICTTHSFAQKTATLKLLKEVGMDICSGGIIGMGESFADRISFALSLAEYGADSIPVNVLMPIKGTPLENQVPLTEEEILRTIAMIRYINPTAQVRMAAGRVRLHNSGENAFKAGLSGAITGSLLTTESQATIRGDKEMLKSIGRETV